MVLDIFLLTALLHFTGGPFNPFSFLYLVEIALAAGFSSQANFTRAFRKAVGVTPTQFRTAKGRPDPV